MSVNATDLMLFNTLPVPAFAVDGSGRVIAWNQAAEQLTGREQETALGRKTWQCFHPRRQVTPVDEVLLSGEAIEAEHAVSIGGEERAVRWIVSPRIAEDGDVHGATAILDLGGGAEPAAAAPAAPQSWERAEGGGEPAWPDWSGEIEQLRLQVAHMEEGARGGDLARRVAVDSLRGPCRAVAASVNNILDSLNGTMSQIMSSAEQIASGISQVSTASQALSDGATRQAASIEEITASIADMTDQTMQNARNAGQANELTTQAGDLAGQGDAQMQAMVRAMSEIDESSQNISKIIKVIDEIAFQTNLLALNAAVEAARAGVHGKGFAVVAEEVRNLAARSANAAKETTVMIEGSIKKVSQGSAIARETADALTQIVDSVGKVSKLVAEIAHASNEQAQGIAQVNEGLKQVDQVTQQNTAGAEESASAAEDLSRQASRLKELVSRFSTSGTQQGVVPLVAANQAGPRPADVIALDDAEFGRY